MLINKNQEINKQTSKLELKPKFCYKVFVMHQQEVFSCLYVFANDMMHENASLLLGTGV